jgi:dynein assembly factor 5
LTSLQGGKQFEKENEDDFKDKMDFDRSDHEGRPFGCRELVQRNFSKLLPGILNDVGDWTVEARR